MKKIHQLTVIIIWLYIAVLFVFYFVIVYPAIMRPRRLSSSSVPSLSVNGLKEFDKRFLEYGKSWVGYPLKPDLTKFVFGQTEPF